MPDKNRNMYDINDQKTAEQQAFSEEIRRRLAEPGSGKPTLDEFKVMVYKDREKRRKKRNALVACIVAAFIVGYLTYDDLVPEVGADKNPKETIQTEDGVIIEDGGYGSRVGKEKTIKIRDWQKVDDAKKQFTGLLSPHHIPEGYIFELLEIEVIVEEDIIGTYIFNNPNTEGIIEIEQVLIKGGSVTTEVSNEAKRVSCKKGFIFLDDNLKIATIQMDDGIVLNISGCSDEEDVIKIIEGMH